MKRSDYITYWTLIALSVMAMWVVVISDPALLLLLGAAVVMALWVIYAITGIHRRQPVASRTRAWRIVGALPFIAGIGFIGYWVLLVTMFALNYGN